ncbi:MAG: HU family DNA-binding protein [Rudaea sp.]|nr:HU family DNA-binding protein [Rudaea sp.]
MAKKATAKPTAKPTHKPIAEAFTKAGLIKYLAERAGVELKHARAVLEALESAIAGSIHKKGIGHFTLPGLLKITSQAVPAKKRRQGIDPFTKQERWFEAKPATVRVKARALRRLKDAAV